MWWRALAEKKRKCRTLDVGRVVDDEDAVPHHGEVDGQVADVAALVVVLEHRGKMVSEC